MRHAFLHCIRCALITMFVSAPVAASAQLPPLDDEVSNALRRGDIGAALRRSRVDAEAHPKEPLVQQILGILLVADNRLPEAEVAFVEAVRLAPLMPPVATGLEDLSVRGTALYRALNRQKVSFSLNGGAAAAYTNLAAVQIARNRADDALRSLEEASGRAPGWGGTAANDAVAWIEKNEPERAEESARDALAKGVETSKVYTTLAEAVFRQGRFDEAKDYLDHADQLDPDYAYALFVRALLYRKMLRTRDAERALFQALALNPNVAAESRYVPMRNEIKTAGGSESADVERLLSDGQSTTLSYRAGFDRTGRDVDDRTGAYQRRYFAEAVLGRSSLNADTTVYGGFLNESGGRPGAEIGSVAPSATFGFNRTNVALLEGLAAGTGARLLLHAGYRHNGSAVRSAPTAASFRPLRDEQVVLEGRWDKPLGTRSALRAGVAWMNNNRDMEMPATGDVLASADCMGPIEPNEQILKDGHSDLLTLYAFGYHHSGSTLTISGGPVVGIQSGSAFGLPYFDVRRILTSRYTLRFSIRPRLLNANADLYPLAALPRRPQEDPIDRREDETDEYNREPILQGPNGRELGYELEVAQSSRKADRASVTAFHRRFSDVFTLSDDPRLAICLATTPLNRGETTGMEAQVHEHVTRGVVVDAFARYQESHTSSPDCNCNVLSGPVTNFPRWQGSLRLDFTGLAGWHFALENFLLGARDVRIAGAGSECQTSTSVGASYALNLHILRRMSNDLSLFLHVYQLAGNGTFCANEPTGRSVIGGFTASF